VSTLDDAPVASVIMTVRNGLPYVTEAVDSVLGQDFGSFELIVVDDGSQDGTVAALQRYDDPRLRVLPCPPNGRVAALNTAVAAARGRYIANLDADDVALPGRLSTSVAFLDAHPTVGAVGSATVPNLGSSGGRIRRLPHSNAAIRWSFLVRNPMVHSAVTFRANALRAVGGYDPAYERRCQDADLLLRVAARYRMRNLRTPLIAKRIHAGQHFAGVSRVHRARVHARLRRRAAAELGFPLALRPLAGGVAGLAALRSYVVIAGLGRSAK
jgi:glycosyltransferase involved in cell wall biosynthesis